MYRESAAGWPGLAATYSSAPWGAVPSALGVFTAEFGMGSGAMPPAVATRPGEPAAALLRPGLAGGLAGSLAGSLAVGVWRCRGWPLRAARVWRGFERLVPVGFAGYPASTPGLST